MNDEDRKNICESMMEHVNFLLEQESKKALSLMQWAIVVVMFTVMLGSVLSIIDFFR